ncbi:putative transcription factor STY-LRP1 family [Helianthus annuus]|nr:putative transcription factor STY-LRP1 family [Helianthus annuus]
MIQLQLQLHIVASSRSTRLSSDHSGAFADWVANPSSSSRVSNQELSLGFHAAGPPTAGGGLWSSPTPRQINYGVPAEMGMFVVAPSNHHPNHHLSDHPHDHPHSLHHTISGTAAATALGVGVGVIPLLTNVATSCSNNNNNINSIQFWQTPQGYSKKGIVSDHVFAGGGGGNGGGGGSVSTSASGSTTTCQDCGNQAKKDCNHRRCRTCCKSRGFDCATHVKSTWVPAARRRERQLVVTSTGGGVTAAGSSASTSGSKKPRLVSRTTTPSHTSTSRSFGTSSSHHQVSLSSKEKCSMSRILLATFVGLFVFCVSLEAVSLSSKEKCSMSRILLATFVGLFVFCVSLEAVSLSSKEKCSMSRILLATFIGLFVFCVSLEAVSLSSKEKCNAKFMQSLPGQVRAPAVFKCVRVTAVEDGDDEYAYQACVTISGHVFKGFLYDQGVETRDQTNVPNLSELHLGGGGGGGRNVSCCLTSPPLNPPAGYSGGLLG